MKIAHSATIVLCLLSIVPACKKDGKIPGPPGGGGTHVKKWLIKDIATPNANGAGHTSHTTYHYNDTGLILKVTFGYDIGADALGSVTFAYRPDGKLDTVKPSNASGLTCHYLSNFSFQTQPFFFNPDHDNVNNYYFNGHSAGEFDGWSTDVPPAAKSGFNYSGQTVIVYNSIGGLQGMTGTDYYNVVQDIFATASGSTNPNDSLFKNPCTNGTSIEQRFIYYFYGLSILSLCPNWLNGTYESYSYNSGAKKATGRWNYSYTQDKDGNVATIVRQYTDNPPAFNDWKSMPPLTLTYEQH